jgi:VWFA-related protein
MIQPRVFRFVRLWALALPAFQAHAQAPSEPSFRVSVDLVQIDAVVTDSKGNHIRDLQPGDFQILVDGKPRKITNFSWIDGDPNPAAGDAPTSPPQSLRKEDIRRSMVLMVDDSGRHAEEDLVPLLASVKKFVAEKLGPRDLTAVTASRGGMSFYQQFTNDKQQLYAAIDRLAHRPGFGMWTLDIPLILDPKTGNLVPMFALAPGEAGLGYRDGNNTPNPIGYLAWAIQGLQNTPGRKAVVLFTHSFAAPLQLIDLANRAGVVIYVIDPHGFQGVVPSTAPYRQLAKQTGGLFLLSAPGDALDRDLAKVLADISGYYLIGYRPDHSDFELSQGRPVHHNIKVRVLRPGLEVRARSGYLGIPDPGARPAPTTTADYLQDAVSSPFSAGSIRVRIEPHYGASAPDPKTKQRSSLLHADLFVDGRDLRLADTDNGGKKLAYSALVVVVGQDGTSAARKGRAFSFLLAPEQAAELSSAGVRPSLDIKLPGPGPYQIRAAIRDETTGDMGSAYTFLNVPDFNQPRISLSSIELLASPPRRNSGGTGWSEYAAGSPVPFRCEVFGFRTAVQPPHDPRVDVQVILFREDEKRPYSDTRIVPVPAASLADHYLASQLETGDLPPGDYAMQLMVWDRLAPLKKQLAVQWTHFAVSTNQ